MTSKLTFRARNLDACRPMSIYNAEDLPELAELNAINRSVPTMPTGMEKEEESEKHLQDILELQNSQAMDKKINLSDLYIPTPEVFPIDAAVHYAELYAGEYKVPRQYIHVQPFSVDSEKPDYDMDSEDDTFMEAVLKKQRNFDVTHLIFEDMIDRLEKNSGQTVVSAKEAKLLLNGDDELILAVYDYWIDKRLRLKQPLIPTVKSDKRDLGIVAPGGTSGGSNSTSGNSNAGTNPYIAFRRRTEKMQTRKNRKNDETSYEKMLKLRRDLSRAVVLLEMIKRREKMKKENLVLTSEIFEKRFQSGDFEGKVLAEVQAQKPAHRMALQPNPYFANRYAESWLTKHQIGNSSQERKDKKRKHGHHSRSKASGSLIGMKHISGTLQQRSYFPVPGNGPEFGTTYASDEDQISPGSSVSEPEEDEMEGPFAFRRQPNVQYLAPLVKLPFGGLFTDEEDSVEGGGWPWESPAEGGGGEPRYRYSLGSLSTPKPRSIGFARRRVGRGGRYLLDRAYTDYDEIWRSLDFSVLDSKPKNSCIEIEGTPYNTDQLNLDDWPHYRPVTPPHCRDDWDPDPYKFALAADHSGLGLPTQPIRPMIGQPGFARSFSHVPAMTPGRSLGLRTVSVDSLGAQNAATALVTTDVMDIFRNIK